MKDRKVSTTLPAIILEKIQSHSVQAMTMYYAKGRIGGCSNSAWPNEDTNEKLAYCLPAKKLLSN